MSLSAAPPFCAICGDRCEIRYEDCCGRCQQMVCGACSHRRGRSHESVLCTQCAGDPQPSGLRATPFYRSMKRLMAA